MVLQTVPPTKEIYRYMPTEFWKSKPVLTSNNVDFGAKNDVYGVPNIGNGEACSAKTLSINADSCGSENVSSETQTTNSQEQRTSAVSSREEKKQAFEFSFSIVLSCSYAVFLVITLGIVIYVTDILTVNSSLAAAFNLYLVIVGLIYLSIYIYRHSISKAKDHLRSITDFDKEALPLTSYQQRGAQDLLNGSYLDVTCQHTELDVVYEWFSPYLYPFTIEYSILVGVPCPPLVGPEAGSNVVLHADCTHSNRGLFGGLLMLVGSIISIIVFFIVVADSRYADFAEFANRITILTLLSVMTLSATFAYRKIVELDVNRNNVSLLEDILLFLAIPAFFLCAIFSIVPGIQRHDYLKIAVIVLEVFQVLIQTPLIIDGLRRCSNSKKLRIEKPSRELVTFLITCNVALWIIQTFEIKSTDTTDYRYDFYGRVLWTILKHMTVPLTIFYRFNSSVCLVNIWKSAYQPKDDFICLGDIIYFQLFLELLLFSSRIVVVLFHYEYYTFESCQY